MLRRRPWLPLAAGPTSSDQAPSASVSVKPEPADVPAKPQACPELKLSWDAPRGAAAVKDEEHLSLPRPSLILVKSSAETAMGRRKVCPETSAFALFLLAASSHKEPVGWECEGQEVWSGLKLSWAVM